MKVAVPKESAPNERRVALVPEVIGKLTKDGVQRVEVSREAEDAWVQAQINSDGGIAKNLGGQDLSCTPGYYNQEGAEHKSRNWKQEQYWGSVMEFAGLLKEWREAEKLEGMQVG